MIPTFPAWTPITLDTRPELHAYLRAHPARASEYTFTNLYAWAAINRYAVTRVGAGFLIRKSQGEHMTLLQPLVADSPAEAVAAGFAYLAGEGQAPVIERVGEDFLATLPAGPWRADEDRDQFDYVYAIEDLVNLAGPRFHDKKNLVNQFEAKYDARYLPLTPDLATRCLAFVHEWCEDRQCERVDGLAQEYCAVVRMLTDFAALEIIGGALEVDARLVAVTLAEPLAPDTLVIHVEKAKSGMTGVYQAINQAFLREVGQGYRYVNREQDLGVPGMRKAKESYNPAHLVKKYRLTPAE